MEEGYYWIARKGFDKKEIAEYDIDNELFFLIGSNYGLKLSDIDLKGRVEDYSERDNEKCNLADVNASSKPITPIELFEKYYSVINTSKIDDKKKILIGFEADLKHMVDSMIDMMTLFDE